MIQIRYQGRNILTHSISTTKYQLIAQEISIGSGLGRNDKEIILPYYLVKERIMTALAEILLVGGEMPTYGIMNILTEDKNSAEEIIRCARNLGEEHNIEFDFSISIVKNSATTIIFNLYSTVGKEMLKVKRSQEGLWLYLLRLKSEDKRITNDTYFRLEFLSDLGSSPGIHESYLLKNESINQAIANLIDGTDTFHVEGKHDVDILTKHTTGTAVLAASPYRLKKSNDDDIEIIEIGSLFKRSYKY